MRNYNSQTSSVRKAYKAETGALANEELTCPERPFHKAIMSNTTLVLKSKIFVETLSVLKAAIGGSSGHKVLRQTCFYTL